MTKEPATPAATPPVRSTTKSAKIDRPPTSSTTSTSPAAVRRSVWGCLTCRRRKVKCQSRDTPCAACKRLQLECVPSFGGNIKQWRRQRMSTATEGPTGPSTSTLTSTPARPPVSQPTTHSPSPALSQSLPSHASPQYDSPSLNAFLAMAQSPGWDLEMPFFLGSAPPFSPDLYAPPSFFTDDDLPVGMDGRLAMTSTPQAEDGFFLSELDMPVSLQGTSPVWSTHSPTHYLTSPLMLPPPTPSLPTYTDSPTDRSLVVYYKRNLASFFSVKSAFASPAASPWNFYAYAIRAAEHQPDSPLRHSILAWTSAYLIVKGDSSPGTNVDMDHALQVRHYARARQAADSLREELQGGKGYSTAVALPTTSASTSSLRMLLATTLFLAYGDILSGDTARLVASLGGIAHLLASDWPRFRSAIGPVEARILVWLAYLDLRAGLWTSQTSPTTKSLFRFLRDHVGGSSSSSGIAALRGNGAPQQYYLAACFGAQLPAHELHDDLLQEPAKRLSDEIMGVFASVADLEGWIEEVLGAAEATIASGSVVPVGTQLGVDTFGADTDILDLRAAKIHAIRATIARIRAESKVVHAALLKAYTPTSPDHVARTTFHRRVSTAMCLAATILLNRVDAPDVRTDDEAQAAAREIVQIARELRTDPSTSPGTESAGYAHPKSLIWPMPVFVAGIEVADPVYQDWVLAYLGDMAGWGTSTRRAKELLRRVLERQDKEGKRVRVKDVIGEFGAVLI